MNTVCLVGAATVGMVLGAVQGLAWAMAAVSVGTLAGFAWVAPRPGQEPAIRRPAAANDDPGPAPEPEFEPRS